MAYGWSWFTDSSFIANYILLMTNKDRANKIKKLLGLRGNDNEKEYYRVADVICDLMHYCDYNKKHPTDDIKIAFEHEYEMAQTFYNEEK